MNGLRSFLKYIVTFSCISSSQIAWAEQDDALNRLFAALQEATPTQSLDIEADIYRELSRSGSDAMDYLLERGQSALAQGDSLRAVEHFTALLDHAPQFAEGYNSRATAYYASGLYGAAISDITTALTLEPRHFGAYAGLALIFEELGQSHKALAALKQAQSVHPHMEGLKGRIDALEQQTRGAAL